MKTKIAILTFVIFLASCTPNADITSVDEATADKVVVTETSTTMLTAVPAETPTIIPTSTEIPYSSLSAAEKLEISNALVEEANSYSGEVSFILESRTSDHKFPVYWNGVSEWKTIDTYSKGGVPEGTLDKAGESLPPVAMAGYENEDGSLVLINPATGQEITFPATVTVPDKGEITVRELMQLSPSQLNNHAVRITAAAATASGNDELRQMQEVMKIKGTAFPGFIIDGGPDLFPIRAALGGKDFPEIKSDILELPTDMVVIPIFSPETDNFMLWVTCQRGHLASVMEFVGQDDEVEVKKIPFGKNSLTSTGNNFAVFMEYEPITEAQAGLPYYRGGHTKVLGLDDSGMGSVSTIKELMEAGSEQAILDILKQQGIIWSIPSVVLY
jgi:hypothetical protein